MLVLTPTQERFILKQLEDCKPFDNGASRICFECPTEIVEALGLNTEYEYIIKLAMGLGGLSQNQLEILTYQQYGESHPLAQIFAAGRYVEIMEKLEIEYDFRDFVDEDCYFCEDDCGEEYWGFNEETASQVQVVVELLSDTAKEWNDLTNKEKKKYEKASEKDRERYELQMEEFKKNGFYTDNKAKKDKDELSASQSKKLKSQKSQSTKKRQEH